MPVYSFVCPSCKAKYDLFLPIKDRHPTACEKCSKRGLLRDYSNEGFFNDATNGDGPGRWPRYNESVGETFVNRKAESRYYQAHHLEKG